MKPLYCFLLVSFICWETVISQNSYQDLIERMSYYTVDSYTSAVDDLQRRFPQEYKPGTKWKEALSELEQFRDEYVEGLRREDLKVKKKVENILCHLDAALLANPLLNEKKDCSH